VILEKIMGSNEISIYRLTDPHSKILERFVVSTEESRAVVNRPEITGTTFRNSLRKAISRTLRHFPDEENMGALTDRESSVLVFLRGGLSFDLTGALADAWNFENHTTSFMTSQRAKDDEGRWYITDFQYQKFDFPKNATIFCGDIVATGTTVQAGLTRMFKLAKNIGKPIKNFVFFTVGCHKIEKVLEDLEKEMRATFKGYSKTYVFYLEGKFHLADSKTLVEIKQQGTDLLREPAIIAPEFELSQYDRLSSVLERCAIYDGGSRSFDPDFYMLELIRYWEEVAKLAENGWTLYRAMKERWSEEDHAKGKEEYVRRRLEGWRGVEREFIESIHDAYLKRWTSEFAEYANTSEALRLVAEKRLHELRSQAVKAEFGKRGGSL
jgi:hypothetical protein